MATTTVIHEQVVDAFDAMITFSYLYEWQQLQNNGLEELLKLRDLINKCVEDDWNDFKDFRLEKTKIVQKIISTLHSAVKEDKAPEEIDFSEQWINLSSEMSLSMFKERQAEDFYEVTDLVVFTIESIKTSVSSIIWPYLSKEQVSAMLDESLCHMSTYSKVLIHKESLVMILHKFFLGACDRGFDQFDLPSTCMAMIKSYQKHAESIFIEYICNNAIAIMPLQDLQTSFFKRQKKST